MDVSVLQNAWEALLTTPDPDKTVAKHAKEFADAYKNFAMTVMAASGATLIVTGEDACESAMLALDNPAMTGPLAAGVYDAAAAAFWASSAFNPLPPAPGLSAGTLVVHSPHLIGPVTAALTAAFAAPSPVASIKAATISAAFLAGVSTITTTHTGVSAVFPFPVITVGPFPVV